MTERSQPVQTLLDVYLRLPAIYSPASTEVYQSAFKRAERLTGERLAQLPARVVEWEKRAARIVWAGEFDRARTPEAKQRAFEGFVKRISQAIRKAHGEVSSASVPGDVATAWERLAAYVEAAETTLDAEGRRLLPNQSSLSIANLRARLGASPPAAIDTAAATAALAHIPPDRVTSYRGAVRFFNGLIVERGRHEAIADLLPEAPIGPLPTLRDRPMDWGLCPEPFRADLERSIARAIRGPRRRDRFEGRLGRDPVAERRRATRGRKRPVRNKEGRAKAFRSAISWLARHAFEERASVYAFGTLEQLLREDLVEAAVDRFSARSETEEGLKPAKETSSLQTYLADLGTIAKRNGAEEELIWAIEDLRFDLGEDGFAAREMSATREAFIKLIDRDPEVVRTIVTGPRVLLREARRLLVRKTLSAHQRTEALHLFMAAAMLAIQLARPLRTRNVHELRSEGETPELLSPRRERASAWLDIARDRTKNRRPVEGKIPDWLWQVISAWLDEGRPAWRERGRKLEEGPAGSEAETVTLCTNDHLFPALSGPGVVSRHLINRGWNRGMARLGLTGLTPHMMRHVAATLYLAKHPGDYPVVAALLADKLGTVEKFYSRGDGRAAMDLFADVLTELDPTLNLKGAA